MFEWILYVAVGCVTMATGNAETDRMDFSTCGDWTPYKDEKCIKIAINVGHQTQHGADSICRAFRAALDPKPYAKLITIKSHDEQAFLQHFLFVHNKIVDNVWLGLKKVNNSDEFEWNDRSKLKFENWANRSDDTDNGRHRCVQMESGEGLGRVGKWVSTNCKKANIVVCERPQTVSLENLQNAFLDYQLEQEHKFGTLVALYTEAMKEITKLQDRTDESDGEIMRMKYRHEEAEREILHLKQNPVPVGFLYVELPGQKPPSILWPQTKWTEVSSKYAGLFFRVEGGGSAPFGEVQEGDSPRLEQVQYAGQNVRDDESNPVFVPPNGSWSRYVYDGSGYGNNFLFLRFKLSSVEVRPRNQSIKIWQRIK